MVCDLQIRILHGNRNHTAWKHHTVFFQFFNIFSQNDIRKETTVRKSSCSDWSHIFRYCIFSMCLLRNSCQNPISVLFKQNWMFTVICIKILLSVFCFKHKIAAFFSKSEHIILADQIVPGIRNLYGSWKTGFPLQHRWIFAFKCDNSIFWQAIETSLSQCCDGCRDFHIFSSCRNWQQCFSVPAVKNTIRNTEIHMEFISVCHLILLQIRQILTDWGDIHFLYTLCNGKCFYGCVFLI